MINEIKWSLFAIFIFNVAFASYEKTKELNSGFIAEMSKDISKKDEENLKVPDECMVCYDECFPVSFQFFCGHEVCAICAQSILKIGKGTNSRCPKCRVPFPQYVTEWFTIIKFYPIYLTPDIPLEKLHIAFPLICSIANLTTVTKCVKLGMDINTKGFLGYFPVHLPSKTVVLKYLLDNGANLNQRRYGGMTPLWTSCQNEYLPVVKYLVENGINVNQSDNHGVTPLFVSSENGYLPIVQYLVENGVNVNQPDNHGVTPLSMSCENGHLPIVQYLVENGAVVDQPDENGLTPLYMSCQEGHLPVVRFLVENSAEVNRCNNDGDSPLFMSCHAGLLDVVKYLVDSGANVNTPRNNGATPLATAIRNNKVEVAKFLLNKNANIEATKLFFQNYNCSEQVDTLEKLCKEMKQ